MSGRIRQHIQQNVVGYVALFLVVSGGTAYATHGAPNSISSGDIIDGEVRTADIRDNNVQRADIDGNAINSAKLDIGAVQSVDVRDDTINNGGLNAQDLNPNSIGSSEIGDNAVGSTEVLGNSLTADDLALNSVTSSEIADNAVGSAEVSASSLRLADLAMGITDESNANLAGNVNSGACSAFFNDGLEFGTAPIGSHTLVYHVRLTSGAVNPGWTADGTTTTTVNAGRVRFCNNTGANADPPDLTYSYFTIQP